MERKEKLSFVTACLIGFFGAIAIGIGVGVDTKSVLAGLGVGGFTIFVSVVLLSMASIEKPTE